MFIFVVVVLREYSCMHVSALSNYSCLYSSLSFVEPELIVGALFRLPLACVSK